MNLFEQFQRRFATRMLTPQRIAVAIALAATADVLQIALVPLAWAFVQQAVDVVTAVVMVLLLGFHVLLLPTFIAELIPGANLLPTWTGCVITVIALLKRRQSAAMPSAPATVSAAPPKPPTPPPLIPPKSGT